MLAGWIASVDCWMCGTEGTCLGSLPDALLRHALKVTCNAVTAALQLPPSTLCLQAAAPPPNKDAEEMAFPSGLRRSRQ